MEKKVKKFKPFKNYRYLVGFEPESKCIADLRQYNYHRYKVFTVGPNIDNRPLKLNPYNYLNKGRITMDIHRWKQIDRENKDLLKKINLINRRGATINSFNPIAYKTMSNWKAFQDKMKIIDYDNKILYGLILTAQSYYSKRELDDKWEKNLEGIKHSCKLPYILSQKKSLDKTLKSFPSISQGLENGKVGRPLCFLDFRETSGRWIGRIIIELYYDHVPVTVQNFLEICTGDKLTYKNCLVHRIVKGQFLETGDITKGNGRGGFSIYGENFHEENHMLKHTRAGIISMKRIGLSENNSQFCITFRKMEHWDRKNVVFGKVIKGNDTLLIIDTYGRTIGKPYVDIMISNCGQIVGHST